MSQLFKLRLSVKILTTTDSYGLLKKLLIVVTIEHYLMYPGVVVPVNRWSRVITSGDWISVKRIH